MSSLVSEFIINPVLRQARRFSEISRTLTGEDCVQASPADAEAVSDPGIVRDTVIEEPEALVFDTDPAMTPETPRSRPVSTSTEETSVERAADSSPGAAGEARHDHLGFPLSPSRGRAIPEDDGMHDLRRRIQAVNAQNISPDEKARQMHGILLEGYRSSRLAVPHAMQAPLVDVEMPPLAREPSGSPGPLESFKSWYSQSAAAEKYMVSASDMAPTFAPIRSRKGSDDDLQNQLTSPSPPELQAPLGCQHYERNVKLQCSTCKRWYTCRFCHDAKEDHSLVRRETRNMLCMLCGTPQRASDMCINCGEMSAHYYCNICKLWENRKTKPIYHCNDCGICRRGLGLGKDFFHCKTCRACITTSIQSSHKCIERSTDCDCPICGEYMFTSPKPVVFMPCGHSIHKRCYDQHMRVSYKCPICNRSLANMESQFRNLDVAILSQPMPPEFWDTRATVLCNDCSGKCVVPYHWLGLKCSICQSYNTVELRIHGHGSVEPSTDTERAGAVVNAQAWQQMEPWRNAANSSAMATVGAVPAGSRVPNRRRHSSAHGAELQHHAPGRLTRSLSPQETAAEEAMVHGGVDIDSDDDIFGFWRGYRSQEDGGDEEEDDDDDDEEEEEEDLSEGEFADDADGDSDDGLGAEDDDDEDDILLIGHR